MRKYCEKCLHGNHVVLRAVSKLYSQQNVGIIHATKPHFAKP